MKRAELVPSSLIFLGTILLSWLVILPILEARASVLRMNSDSSIVSGRDIGGQISRSFNLPSLPFPSLVSKENRRLGFFLTIEKLGIKRATVLANLDGGDSKIYLRELLAGIGHLKGSAFPGERGNTFLFGHSSLPFLFHPDDYSTIFSRLDKLKEGDLVVVEFAGRKISYRVSGSQVVSSQAQIKDFLTTTQEKLTLLTCFPPGLETERLLVTALPVVY